MEGIKYDNEKPQLAAFYPDFAKAYRAMVEVAQYGAGKYKEERENPNWLNVENSTERYKNSLFRHLDKYLTGEYNDKESGHSHLAHILWNAAILYQLEEKERTFNPWL